MVKQTRIGYLPFLPSGALMGRGIPPFHTREKGNLCAVVSTDQAPIALTSFAMDVGL